MRRDLKQLAEEGRCQKVYGGATRVENVRERPMSARIDQHAGEKLAIACKALPLVGPRPDRLPSTCRARASSSPALSPARAWGARS